MSAWNHLCCERCWNKRNPDRPVFRLTPSPGELGEVCCFCSAPSGSGIYVRAAPLTMPCSGKGLVHQEQDS